MLLLGALTLASCGSSDATQPRPATDDAGPGDAGAESASGESGTAPDTDGNLPPSPGGYASTDSAGAPSAITGCKGTAAFSPTGPAPSLVAGQWTNISPAGVDLSSPDTGAPRYGTSMLALDPCNTSTLYVSVDQLGMWKTTDAGSTWTRLGSPPAMPNFSTSVSYLDSPVGIRVDPANSKHLYATQGVRGTTLGFWVSEDGGATWNWPPGFVTIAKTATNDVTSLAVDPADFAHLLLSSHSPWAGNTPAGVLESTDGGMTFVAHPPPAAWPNGTIGVNFLHDPDLGIGSARTWLISVDGSGLWLTPDAGTTWSNVSSYGTVHGGNGDLYFTRAGVVYAGANHQMVRSADRGLTWEAVGPSFPDGYYQVIGDGTVLYAQESNTGASSVGPQPYITSPETDGTTWTPYQGGAQTFPDGPICMRFDPIRRVLYSSNWRTGVWALKVL
jgi:photosystem II stability/assembly factor-like uncharacterized protein